MRRAALGVFVLSVQCVLFACRAPAPVEASALDRLKAGNARFVAGKSIHQGREHPERRHDTAAHGQHPYAVVVACSDSRVPVELLFDQGIGDVFVVRVAGNICYDDEAASVEYAVEHLHVPCAVVLGHTQCGAVTAAVDHAREHGSLPRLLSRIEPAVHVAEAQHPPAAHDARVAAAIVANVRAAQATLIAHSEIVRSALDDGRLEVVGALYDIDTGGITWLGPHPEQDILVCTTSEDGW